MIKVTIGYKNNDDRYGSEETYLVNTDDHQVAVIMATMNHRQSKPEANVNRVYTNVETDVIEPTVLARY